MRAPGCAGPAASKAGADRMGLLRAKQAVARVARAISTFEPVMMAARPLDAAEAQAWRPRARRRFSKLPLDNSWARDSGPTFVTAEDGTRGAVQWEFNAWGNKYHPWTDDAQFASRVARQADVRLYAAPLVCEGGAIHTDGAGHADHDRTMPAQRQPQSASRPSAGRGATGALHRRAARDLAGRRLLRRRDRRPCRQHRLFRRARTRARRRAKLARRIPTLHP